MKNSLNLTEEMKNMVREWKGKLLKGYVENADDGYVTRVRFLIGESFFDFDNEYTAYQYPDEGIEELTCFSCVEVPQNKILETVVVGGKHKKHIIEEKIENIYIIKDIEKGKLFDSGIPYELEFETALIIQTENKCYAFWRNLIFYTIDIAVCTDIESVLKTIRSVDEIQKEAQIENPYPVTVEREMEQL